MANSDNLKKFTNLYQVSKTLRFELIPQGKTLEHIEKNGLLEQDEHRAESYILVKKIIDEYHKAFISGALENLKLNYLDDYLHYYQIPKRSEDEKKKFDEMQTKLRKQIADSFTKHAAYKNLFAKELIKEDLKAFVQTDEDKKLVEEFDNFTTYFTGFHENRKNMYSAEEKSTAIAFRLIHQNLPKFIDNMRTFEKVGNSPVKNNFPTILSNEALGPIVQVGAVEDMFTMEYFNETLTQKGIDIYNQLIGGYTPEDSKEKIKGLNEYINLYNQTAKKEERIPRLKPLYKQILSDRSTASYIPEQFANDNEVLESIEKFYQEINEHVLNKNVKGEHSLKGLLENLGEFDLHKVFLRNDLSLTDISQKMFGDWGFFQKAMNSWYNLNNKGKAQPGTEKYEEEQKKYFRNQDSFSVGFINDCLLLTDNSGKKTLEEYFKLSLDGTDETGKTESLFVRLENNYNTVKDLLNNPYPQDKDLAQDETNVDKIKTLLDSIKAVQWFIKPLLGKGNEAEKDERFYGEFSDLWTTLDQVTPLYNKVRNYMTRKPYSTEKMKLNFENSTLLDGWDVNKEADNTGIIFRKDGLFYLGIMNKKHNKIFKKEFKITEVAFYEKMEYKLLPGANKMLPKVFFSNSRIAEFNPSNELMEHYKNETHKKGEKFNLQHCHELIDFFKTSIDKHEDWKQFGFQFSETKSYEDLSGFYREVEKQGYKITFSRIPETYMADMVEQGKLYLFQIYNKDFSPYSKGTPNMHTLYWKMLFDEDNLKNIVYKLNG
ncbi:MAG: type V CRISPR-associated protein Cas12a/Cpf1, partial [Bacteroidales bacterium]|nr:type V CRISPR-associated protein Cas12a/Cpf1 [Bacteroidales bacterium]